MRPLALTLVTLLLPLEVYAQTGWFELPVPTKVLAPLGVDLTLGTSLALERTVRVLHAAPRDGDAPAHIAEFESLVAALDTFELEAQRLGPRGLSLEMSRNASERDVLQDVLKTLGFRLRDRGGTYTVEADRDNDEAARRKLLDAAGLATTTIADRLNAGEALTLTPEITVMPSPLPLDAWTAVIFQRVIPPRALFSAIARDRRAALLFVGLKAMTPATRGYLAKDRDLLRRLYEDGTAVGAFGEILQIDTAGKLVLPGGPNATPLWQGLVGEPLEQVAPFARAIFSRDNGRLAFFVSTLAHLDEPHRNFALGMSIADQGIRLDRFRALYRTFVDIDSNWSVATLPFVRPLYDPATLLSLVRVDAAGAPARPNFRRLWDKALDGIDLPSPSATEVGNTADDGRVDAAWLAEHTRRDFFDDRRVLTERVAFGQRVFSTAADGEMEDVLTALRAFGRFPALMLAIERIGVRNPAVFALVARRAREMEDITEPVLAVPVFGQFQGAIALLERVARTGAIDTPAREALVRSLTALPILEGHYNGAFAGWLSTELLPAFGPQTGAERPLESALLRGLAERGEAKPFEWEGSSYVTDLMSRSLRELEAIRAKQGGNHLDDVVALWTATRALEQPNLTVDVIEQGTASLQAAGAHLQPLRPWPDVDDELVDVKRTLERAVRDLSRITKPKDAEKAARIVRPVTQLVDALLAETVVALAYAPWLGDSSDIRGPQADISHRHSFGLRSTNGAVAERRPWQRTTPDGSRAVSSGFIGSLLALDLVMAPKLLRRLATDAVPSAPRLNPNDRMALTEALALLNPRELNNSDLQAVGQAVAKGRALVQSTKDSAALDVLAGRASVSGHRRQALSWAIQHEPGNVARLFSMSELLALGLADNGPALDPWGTTGEPTSGCFCLRFPSRSAWDMLAGRKGRGFLATAMPDVTLRSLEHLATLDVPAALAPGVVAMATQSFIDTAPALYDDDWVGLVGHSHGLTRESVEDYVAALVADGPVRPVTSGDAGR